MKKFECRGCENHCVVTTNDDCCPVLCHLVYEDWHEIKEETTTKSNEWLKLTVDVFNRPDCPEWAKYAFINGSRTCVLFEEKPYIGENGCDCIGFRKKKFMEDWGRFEIIKGEYVERPAKALPDWIKECAVGYDNEQERYFEITDVDEKWVDIEFLDDGVGATCDYSDIQKCSEARKRKFNDKEMKALVGRIFTTLDGDASIATDFDKYLKTLHIFNEGYTNKQLADSAWLLDGKPCYVLEHLNEKGEWVE